jgi:AcrR family transcriptional regulator
MKRKNPVRAFSIRGTSSGGRRNRRAAETRLRLFRCALQLVAERGLPRVTVEDITEAADVGKGTFFNYFESKNHLLATIVDLGLDRVREALGLAVAGKSSIESVLRHLFEQIAEDHHGSPEVTRAFISSFVGSETVRRQLDHKTSDQRRLIARIVEIGQGYGEIDRRLKKDEVALLLQQAFMGALLLWSLRDLPSLRGSMSRTFQHTWRAISVSAGAGE